MKTIQKLFPLLLLLGVASCVQVASDNVAPTQVGNVASFTPVPTITPTALPTEIPTEVVETAEVEAATEEVIPINEPTEASLLLITDTAIPSATPSHTPSPTATSTFTPPPTNIPTATPTEAVAGLVGDAGQDDGVPIQQDPPVQDPGTGGVTEFELTATQLIVDATDTAATATRQAEIDAGIGDAAPTATPTPITGGDGLGDGSGVVATQPPVSIQPGADCIHEVRAVDRSLYRLSLAYGVTVNQIATASGIVNPDLIRIGQRLTIPGCGTTGGVPPATSTPGPNDNIGGPGVVVPPSTDCTFGTSVTFPSGCPDGSTPGNTAGGAAGSTVPGTGGPATGSGTVIRVQQGETLFEISLRTGVPVASIAAANGITDYDRIFLNQELIIP